MTTDTASGSPALPHAVSKHDDRYVSHYRTYRGFLLGVGLFAAHVVVILIFLAASLL